MNTINEIWKQNERTASDEFNRALCPPDYETDETEDEIEDETEEA